MGVRLICLPGAAWSGGRPTEFPCGDMSEVEDSLTCIPPNSNAGDRLGVVLERFSSGSPLFRLLSKTANSIANVRHTHVGLLEALALIRNSNPKWPKIAASTLMRVEKHHLKRLKNFKVTKCTNTEKISSPRTIKICFNEVAIGFLNRFFFLSRLDHYSLIRAYWYQTSFMSDSSED